MAWYSQFLDPTDVKGLLFITFILYLINLAYESWIAPHLSGYVDGLEDRTRKRIIEQRKFKEQREKEVRDEISKRLKGRNIEVEDDGTLKEIQEEEAGEDEEETGKEENIPKKKKNKKKANKTKQEKVKAE